MPRLRTPQRLDGGGEVRLSRVQVRTVGGLDEDTRDYGVD